MGDATELVYLNELPGRTLVGDTQPVTGVSICEDGSIELFYDGAIRPFLGLTNHRAEVVVAPPVPVVVKVEDANDAQALIGRSIDGERVVVVHTGQLGCTFRPAGSPARALASVAWGESVTVDPEPPPAPVEPDTVGVIEAARALVALYSPLDFTEDRVRLLWADLVAALAAEGDGR